MDKEGIEKLFGKIEAITGEAPVDVDLNDHVALQGLGHEYLRQRQQKQIDYRLGEGWISKETAQKLTDANV